MSRRGRVRTCPRDYCATLDRVESVWAPMAAAIMRGLNAADETERTAALVAVHRQLQALESLRDDLNPCVHECRYGHCPPTWWEQVRAVFAKPG